MSTVNACFTPVSWGDLLTAIGTETGFNVGYSRSAHKIVSWQEPRTEAKRSI